MWAAGPAATGLVADAPWRALRASHLSPNPALSRVFCVLPTYAQWVALHELSGRWAEVEAIAGELVRSGKWGHIWGHIE